MRKWLIPFKRGLPRAFYLSLETDSKWSNEEAHRAGEVALTRMNAICLVQDERFRPPTIAGVSRRDPDTGQISTIIRPKLRIHARSGVRLTPTVREADGTIRPGGLLRFSVS